MKTKNKQSSTDGRRNIATVSQVRGCKKYPHAPNFNVEQNAPKHKHKKNKNDANIEIGGLGVSLWTKMKMVLIVLLQYFSCQR